MSRGPRATSAALLIGMLGGAGVPAATVDHKAVGCVVADQYPRLEARTTPLEAFGRARVFFRAEGGGVWYAVAMKREGDLFAASLPKPQKALRAFLYYVEVADKSHHTTRTAEYRTRVVAVADGCDKQVMGASTAAASVLLEVPSGAAAVPAGFSSVGVVSAGVPAAGAEAGQAAHAAASAGGGLGPAPIVAGGVVAAAGITAGVVLTRGDEGIVGTWEGTRIINNGPLFADCTRRFTEIWTIQQSGADLTADVQAIGEGCGSDSCPQNCNIFWFPWKHVGTLEGSTARFVVFGGTTCVFSLKLSGDTLAGSMSPCRESPGMTQDVALRRKKP